MAHAIPDGKYTAQSIPEQDAGRDVLDQSGRVSYQHVKLGSKFFENKRVDDQAWTLIHESAHVLAGAEDDVIGAKGHEKWSVKEAIDGKVPGVQIRNPNHGLAGKPTYWNNGGCTCFVSFTYVSPGTDSSPHSHSLIRL